MASDCPLEKFLQEVGLGSFFRPLQLVQDVVPMRTVYNLIAVVAKDGVVQADHPLLVQSFQPIQRIKLCKHLGEFLARKGVNPSVSGQDRSIAVNFSASKSPLIASCWKQPQSRFQHRVHNQTEWDQSMSNLALSTQRKPRTMAMPSFFSPSTAKSTTMKPLPLYSLCPDVCVNHLLNLRILARPNAFRPGTFCYFPRGCEKSSDVANNLDPLLHDPSLPRAVLGQIVQLVGTHTGEGRQSQANSQSQSRPHSYCQVQLFREVQRGAGQYCATPIKSIVAVGHLLPLQERLTADKDLDAWRNVQDELPMMLLPTPPSERVHSTVTTQPQGPGETPILGWRAEFAFQDARVVAANFDVDVLLKLFVQIAALEEPNAGRERPDSNQRRRTRPSSNSNSIGMRALIEAFGGGPAAFQAMEKALKHVVRRPVKLYFIAEALHSHVVVDSETCEVEVTALVRYAAHTYQASVISSDPGPSTIQDAVRGLCNELGEILRVPELNLILARFLNGTVNISGVRLGGFVA